MNTNNAAVQLFYDKQEAAYSNAFGNALITFHDGFVLVQELPDELYIDMSEEGAGIA